MPALLAFTNALCDALDKAPERADAFAYDEHDRFPVDPAMMSGEPALGVAPAFDLAGSAQAVAGEIARLLQSGTVRDRQTGVARAVRPGDIAILFRSREGHQEFETALQDLGISTYVYKGLGFFDTDEVTDVVAVLRLLADPASDLRAAALLRSRFVRLSDPGLAALAPNIAASLAGAVDGDTRLDADSAAVMARVRASVPGWIAMADRVPPAELLDRVIAESAYEFELAGPRSRQARENLKKIRALVRRIQNRGYTTLARVTEHLDRLSAGDESNAAFDAVDAVNLMTVHAAKGLEFPVVFLVHLGKGAGGGRDPIRLSGVTEDETPSIAVGDFRSEADDDAALREREETKRLLYVAVTRARDRLYFSSVLADRGKEAVFLAGRGGLGDVLPPDFRQTFVDATRGVAAELSWVSGGAAHRFRVCRILEGQTPPSPQPVPAEQVPFDLQRLGGVDADRGSMSAVELSERRGPVEAPIAPDADARLVGLVVHRLLDRYGVAPPMSARSEARRGHASQSRRAPDGRKTAGDGDRGRPELSSARQPPGRAGALQGRPCLARGARLSARGRQRPPRRHRYAGGWAGWPGLGAGVQDGPGQRGPPTAACTVCRRRHAVFAGNSREGRPRLRQRRGGLTTFIVYLARFHPLQSASDGYSTWHRREERWSGPDLPELRERQEFPREIAANARGSPRRRARGSI